MKIKMKTGCSAIAVVTWCVLVFRRGGLISSGKCEMGTPCDLALLIVMSLVGLYIFLELLVAPESAALYILSKAIRRGRSSSDGARAAGVFGAICMLVILCWSVLQLFGPNQ